MSRSTPTVSTPKGVQVKVPCAGSCSGKTFHDVVASAHEVFANSEYHYEHQHEIIQCCGCGTVSFRADWQDRDDYEIDDEGNAEPRSHEELFPPRVTGRKAMSDIDCLPTKVRTIYSETLSAIHNRQGVLAGIGIRALIEAVCVDRKARKGTLEQRIDKLVELGILSPLGAEILHRTRLMGNTAAHEVEPQAEDVLNAAMGIAESLLTTVYVLPKHAKALPVRRNKTAGGKGKMPPRLSPSAAKNPAPAVPAPAAKAPPSGAKTPAPAVPAPAAKAASSGKP